MRISDSNIEVKSINQYDCRTLVRISNNNKKDQCNIMLIYLVPDWLLKDNNIRFKSLINITSTALINPNLCKC